MSRSVGLVWRRSSSRFVLTRLCRDGAGGLHCGAGQARVVAKAVLVGLSAPTDRLLPLVSHSARVATVKLP